MANDNTNLNIQITAEDLASAVIKGISEGFGKVEESIKKTINPAAGAATGISGVGTAADMARQPMTSMFDIAGSLAFSFNNIVTAAQTAWSALNQVIEPALKMERLNTVLKSATGSSQEAGLAFEFVKNESNRLGLDLQTTAQSFSRLALAARGTSMEGETARKMFTGFAEGFAAMKLTVDETNRVFTQITQGMNKGKLELEDLKIIAEGGIPIFKLLAEAIGKTQPEIMKMISDGQLLSNDVYPKLAESMHKAYGEEARQAAAGTQAELARVKNETFLASAAFAKDLLPSAVMVFQGLSAGIQIMSAVVDIFKVITSAVFGLGFAFAEVTRAFFSGDMFSASGIARFRENMGSIKSTFMDTLDSMSAGSGQFHKSEQQLRDESARNEQRRLQEAKDALAANVAAQEKYIKTIADTEARLTLQHKQEYEERKKTINTYFEGQLKTVVDKSAEWYKLTVDRNVALAKLERERASTSALIAVEIRDRALKEAAGQAQAEIALVEKKLASQEISQREAGARIMAINKAQAAEELKLAEQRISVMAVAGLKGTEEYKKALDEQVRAQKAVNALMFQEIKNSEAEKKAARALESQEYKSNLDRQLFWLQENLAAGNITERQAQEERLRLEVEYSARILEQKRQLLAQTPRENSEEYAKALSEKEAAEKSYNEKRLARESYYWNLQRNLAEESARQQIEKQKALDAENAAREAGWHEFAAWFARMWQQAIDDATAQLQKLSTAAYNIWAQWIGKPLISTDNTIEAVKGAISSLEGLDEQLKKTYASRGAFAEYDYMIAKSLANSFKMHEQLQYTLDQAFQRLESISIKANNVALMFNKQKLAALEIGEALKEPINKTFTFVEQSARALLGLDLLDKSTLDQVKGQIDGVKNAMLAFTEQIMGALKALQDEWDNLTMSKLQLEEKRYQEQKAKAQKDLAEAQSQYNNDAIVALKQQLELIDKIHKVKLADLAANPDNSKTPVLKLASGGRVPGIGSGDTVPAMLTPGEYVIRKDAVAHWGAGLMDRLNNMIGFSLPRIPAAPRLAFAGGGMVPEVVRQQSGTSNINFTIYTQKFDESTVRREIVPVLEKIIRLKG